MNNNYEYCDVHEVHVGTMMKSVISLMEWKGRDLDNLERNCHFILKLNLIFDQFWCQSKSGSVLCSVFSVTAFLLSDFQLLHGYTQVVCVCRHVKTCTNAGHNKELWMWISDTEFWKEDFFKLKFIRICNREGFFMCA